MVWENKTKEIEFYKMMAIGLFFVMIVMGHVMTERRTSQIDKTQIIKEFELRHK